MKMRKLTDVMMIVVLISAIYKLSNNRAVHRCGTEKEPDRK
jgi:hypothetical protein